jgi:hypothetical protein
MTCSKSILFLRAIRKGNKNKITSITQPSGMVMSGSVIFGNSTCGKVISTTLV